MAGKKKVPEIRFKGFTGEWEEKEYCELFSIIPNNTLSRAELNTSFGLAKNIHYGDVLIKYNELLDIEKDEVPYITNDMQVNKFKSSELQNGDVVIADAAEDEMVGKCTEIVNVNNNIVFSGLHTIPSRPKIPFALGYLGYFMNSPAFHDQLLRLMQGTKVLSISKATLQNTLIYYPLCNTEQLKIGTFLKDLDSLIMLHQRKLDKLTIVKKSMLDKMFPHDGANVPEIRFKGFNYAWGKFKLGKIVERIVRKNSKNQSALPLTISAQYGLVDQSIYFNNRVASRDISNYYLVLNGEFAYNKSTSEGFPFGTVKRLDLYESGVLSTLYIVFAIRDCKETDSNFLTVFFDTDRWHKEVSERAAEGARNHGLLNITADDFLDIGLYIPKETTEQKKIGTYFKNLDKLITLNQNELDKLKKIKQACLDKMFT